jgi:hypothetical protein
MTSWRIVPAPTRLLVWALALQSLFSAGGCDRSDDGKSSASPRAGIPVTSPSTEVAQSEPAAEEFSVKLAALRQLISDQPRAADRAAFAAYLVRDAEAAKLAEALAAATQGAGSAGQGPPVVASVDSYKKKGRTIDVATGRPVKVLLARVAQPPGADATGEVVAEVVASWQAGKLAGASCRYRMRKEAGAWVVVGRVDEGP